LVVVAKFRAAAVLRLCRTCPFSAPTAESTNSVTAHTTHP
jgi:hypothetical protein